MKCRKLSEPTEAAAHHGHTRSTTAAGQRQRCSTAQGPQQGATSGQGGPGQPKQLLHSSGGCGDVSTIRHGHGQTQRNTGTKEDLHYHKSIFSFLILEWMAAATLPFIPFVLRELY